MATSPASAVKLSITDGTIEGDYNFTFDSTNASKVNIEITDTDASKDTYEFFGGIFSSTQNDFNTKVAAWKVGSSADTAVTFKWTPGSTESGSETDAKLEILGFDNATSTTSISFIGNKAEGSRTVESESVSNNYGFANNVIKFSSSTDKTLFASLDMTELMNAIKASSNDLSKISFAVSDTKINVTVNS